MKPNNNKEKQALPFLVEFVKFVVGFAAIVAIALLALKFTSIGSQVAAVINSW